MSARPTRKASVEPRSRTQWARLRKLDDGHIDYGDIPATTPEFWAPAILVHPSRKVPVSLRLDEDVLAWFKSQGARYQTRINAVLRAYVERHPSGRHVVEETAAPYKSGLLADLEVARERYEALENLKETIAPRILDCAQRRIQAVTGGPRALKLPVLFFFLVRQGPRELRRFDEFLGRLRRSHRKRELPNLLDRLRSEEDYRRAVDAIFEVQILRTLLDVGASGSVSLYPRIDATQKHADAAIQLGQTTVYIEVKLISQDVGQERIEDIGVESALGQPAPSPIEMRKLGIHSVTGGVVAGVGDPYRDAWRVIRKLTEKPGQLHSGAPNVVCLGLADLFPHPTSVEWAIEAVFAGSPAIPRIVTERASDAERATTPGQLAREAKPEPRLSGVIVFDVKEGRALPLKAFRNAQPAPSSRLYARDWHRLLTLFGIPQTTT